MNIFLPLSFTDAQEKIVAETLERKPAVRLESDGLKEK